MPFAVIIGVFDRNNVSSNVIIVTAYLETYASIETSQQSRTPIPNQASLYSLLLNENI